MPRKRFTTPSDWRAVLAGPRRPRASKRGLIISRPCIARSSGKDETGAKKLCTITAQGRAHLDENRDFVTAVLDRLAAVGRRITRMRRRLGEDERGALPPLVKAALDKSARGREQAARRRRRGGGQDRGYPGARGRRRAAQLSASRRHRAATTDGLFGARG